MSGVLSGCKRFSLLNTEGLIACEFFYAVAAYLPMDIVFYKSLHLVGIAALLIAVGASLQAARLGVVKADNPSHKSNAILHGVALLILLVSGFNN